MDSFFSPEFVYAIARLTIAMLLGLVLGLERISSHKTAGLRTYALVSMASALFVVVGQQVSLAYAGVQGFDFDPLRIASQIVVGVGFLGAGLIIFKEKHIHNLTTAAGLWIAAAIGMACGFGLFREAIYATLMTLFVLGVLRWVERGLRKNFFGPPEE